MKKCKKAFLIILIFIMSLNTCNVAFAAGPGIVSKKTSEFLREIADDLLIYTSSKGISLDSIIYNRDYVQVPYYKNTYVLKEKTGWFDNFKAALVGGIGKACRISDEVLSGIIARILSDKVEKTYYYEVPNVLKFSFKDDSVFGEVSNSLYKMLKYIATSCMLGILYLVAIRSMLSGTIKDQFDIKEKLKIYVLAMFLIFTMPKILEVFNFLITEFSNAIAPSDGTGITFVNKLRQASKATNSFLYSAMYLGSVVLTLWFAIVYCYRDVVLIFLYAYFPLFALFLNGNKVKMVFESWTKVMLSFLLVPLIDAGLFLSVTKVINNGFNELLALIIASCIIPVRGLLRNLIGMGGGRSEYFGFLALTGVARLASTGIRGFRKGTGNIAEGFNDIRESNKFGKQFNNEGATGIPNSQYNTNFGSDSNYIFSKPNMKNNPTNLASTVQSEIYSRQLKREGRKKIQKGVLSMKGGVRGATIGAATFAMMGPAAATHAAAVGGEAGFTAGELAGGFVPDINISDLFRNSVANQKSKNNSNTALVSKDSSAVTLPNANADTKNEDNAIKANSEIAIGIDDSKEKSNEYNFNRYKHYGLNQVEGIKNAGSLPKGVQSLGEDINKLVDDELGKEIADKSYEKTISSTGINPQELGGQYNKIAGNYYNEKLNTYKNEGINITPEIKINVKKEAEAFAYNQLDIDKRLETFNSVYGTEYLNESVDALYEKLQQNGYSANMLDGVQDSLKDEIAKKIEKDLNNQDNGFTINNVDDII